MDKEGKFLSVKSLVFRKVTAIVSYIPHNTAPTFEAEILERQAEMGKQTC